jgi:hypothetical protein
MVTMTVHRLRRPTSNMMPDEMPQAFKDASAEFIALIEPILRKKGHGSPLLHALEGLAELGLSE